MVLSIIGVVTAIAIVYAILDASGIMDLIWEILGVMFFGYFLSLGVGTLASWLGASYEIFQKWSYIIMLALLAIDLIKRFFR